MSESTNEPAPCSEQGCERRTCRPPDYTPLCSRHYLRAVDRAQAEAHERFVLHVARLRLSRRSWRG